MFTGNAKLPIWDAELCKINHDRRRFGLEPIDELPPRHNAPPHPQEVPRTSYSYMRRLLDMVLLRKVSKE
jgi:hypothetical protein